MIEVDGPMATVMPTPSASPSPDAPAAFAVAMALAQGQVGADDATVDAEVAADSAVSLLAASSDGTAASADPESLDDDVVEPVASTPIVSVPTAAVVVPSPSVAPIGDPIAATPDMAIQATVETTPTAPVADGVETPTVTEPIGDPTAAPVAAAAAPVASAADPVADAGAPVAPPSAPAGSDDVPTDGDVSTAGDVAGSESSIRTNGAGTSPVPPDASDAADAEKAGVSAVGTATSDDSAAPEVPGSVNAADVPETVDVAEVPDAPEAEAVDPDAAVSAPRSAGDASEIPDVADGIVDVGAPTRVAETASTAEAPTPTVQAASAPTPRSDAPAAVADAAPGPSMPAETTPTQQVAEALREVRRLADGSHRLSLQLHPEELGAVQLEVAIRDGQLHVRAVAETEAARTALEQNLPELRSDLRDAGVRAGSLEVGPDASGRDRSDAPTRDARTPDLRERADDAPPTDTTPDPSSPSGLDIRL